MTSSVTTLITLVILATCATDYMLSEKIYASENPAPVGTNVTLYSPIHVTLGIWQFNNSIAVTIVTNFTLHRSRIFYNSTTSSLTIMSVQLNDSGTYELVQLLPRPFVALVTLSVQAPISNVSLKASATNLVEFNDTVVFTCSISSGTNPSYVWWNGSSVVQPGSGIQLSDGDSKLTITNVTRYDMGPFKCNVSNGVSAEISMPISLNISYGPDDTIITLMPGGPIYRAGSDIQLSCSVKSHPPAVIKWMFDGGKVFGSQLHLERVNVSNSGSYKCLSHNTVTSRFSSASVNITVMDPVVSVVVNGSGRSAFLNESFTLSCEVSGPAEHIYWWRNGHRLVADNTTVFGKNNKTVTLDPVQHSDGGQYECQALNAVSNMTSSSYTLHVNYGPKMPTIVGPTTAWLGSKVKFTCQAPSYPPSTYKWFFNHSVVANMSMYITPPLTMNMSGMYTCMAFNEVTGKNSTAHKTLTVYDPITHVQIHASMKVPIADHNYTLTCNVTGDVEYVSWMKNGEQLYADKTTILSMDNRTVIFQPLGRNDTGTYTCMAINPGGNMSSLSYKLLVNFGPDTPIIKGPHYAVMGQRAEFSCSAMSVPPSNFSWWFNGSLMATTATFTTDPLSLNMTGNYTCLAKNHLLGTNSSSSVMLMVIEDISVMVKANMTPISSKIFTLTCEVNGSYHQIYWMKDNKTMDHTANMAYRIEKNTLTFTPLTRYNDGSYQCDAINAAGSNISPPYKLTVIYGPLNVMIKGPSSATEGSDVSLQCLADCYPDCIFTWFFLRLQSSGSVFTFTSAKDREGMYTCEAMNPVTNMTAYSIHYLSAHAPALLFPTRGGLMLMGVLVMSLPVLFH